MRTLTFKTDIKCSGCVARVTPHLNNLKGVSKWSVNILDPEKTLTIETEQTEASEIIDTVKKAGFKAEEKNKQ